MIKIKTPLSPLELSIVSGIDDVQANHIKFHNISFCCDSIEDCEGRVFIQRKKGTWIDTGSGQECSECHEIQYGYDSYRFYCPNCGADMRGE